MQATGDANQYEKFFLQNNTSFIIYYQYIYLRLFITVLKRMGLRLYVKLKRYCGNFQ